MHINLGLAHGVPGVIAFLARVHILGIDRKRTAKCLRDATEFLLLTRLSNADSSVHLFPYWLGLESDPVPARLGWCYGELSVGASLCAAALATDDEVLRGHAKDIACSAALRSRETSGIQDACLCHGSSGVAHILRRLAEIYDDDLLMNAATLWLKIAIDQGTEQGGYGGYLFHGLDGRDNPTWHTCFDLLNGSAGVGLSLLSASGLLPPNWDQFLLVGPPYDSECGLRNAPVSNNFDTFSS